MIRPANTFYLSGILVKFTKLSVRYSFWLSFPYDIRKNIACFSSILIVWQKMVKNSVRNRGSSKTSWGWAVCPRSSSNQCRLPSKVVRLSFIQDYLPSKVIFHQSSILFHPRSSSIQGRLTSKVASIQDRRPSKVIFYPRLSSIQGCLPSRDIFHLKWSSI